MKIKILTEVDPESTAMLQAFYSRNHKPIEERLKDLDTDSIKESLKKYYIGYGHKSIGQCGSFTIFIEDVSLIAAKAIQDSKLYNGQETSTRYIDFSTKEMYYDFKNTTQKRFLKFYEKNQEKVLLHVAEKYDLNLDNPIELKTAKARSFDILRGFLPAGCKTQLSWHSTFANARERLVQLYFHPLNEVREIAKDILNACLKEFPYVFSGVSKDILKFKNYYTKHANELNYCIYSDFYKERFRQLSECSNFNVIEHITTDWGLNESAIINRPKGMFLTRKASYNGYFRLEYILDYGSFRDIQRHRNCLQMLPVLTTELGFNSWYLDNLPDDIRKEAEELLESEKKEILEYKEYYDDIKLQYFIPIGYNVGCVMECDIPQLVYLSELRSSKTVHPTLRNIAKKMSLVAEKYVPVYSDKSEDEIDLRRGTQDIVEI